jgi:Tol biopolymer transport system component
MEPDGEDTLYRVPALGGEPRRLLKGAAGGEWSPNGQRLAFVFNPRVDHPTYVLGVSAADGSAPREIVRVDALWMSPPRWSPDGRWIAVTHGRGAAAAWSTLVIDPDSGARRQISPPRPFGPLSAPAWAASGRELLLLQSDLAHDRRRGRLFRQPFPEGRPETLLRLLAVGPGLSLAAPGQVVFDASSVRQNLSEQPLMGSAAPPRWLTRGHSEDRQPVCSPDGERVVFTSNRSGNLDLWELTLASGSLRRLTDHPTEDIDPYVMRDGRLLWSSKRTGAFEIWMAEPDGSSPRQVTRDDGDDENPVATPDGRWIVYTAADPRRSGLWKIRTDGTGARRLLEGTLGLADISPDGERVVFVEFRPPLSFLRVARLADGHIVPFQIAFAWKPVALRRQGEAEVVRGRSRWVAGGTAIAYVDMDEKERTGVFVQDFVPGRDTTSTRRPVGGFSDERRRIHESAP